METTYRAVIYPDENKIGCVLLQAAYGGEPLVARWFDPDLWALYPLPNPRPVSGTKQQWERLAEKWRNEWKTKS